MDQTRRQFLTTSAVAGAAIGSTLSSSGLAGETVWHASRLSFPEIVYDQKSPAVRYAAEQLKTYLSLVLGADNISNVAGGPRIFLENVRREDLGDEGFELECRNSDLFVRGGPAGIVYGTFDFLRRYAGCCFAGLAPYGEEIPRREHLDVTPFRVVRKPKLWYRGYQFPWREPLELIIKRLDWMARNGLNYVMYCPLRDDVTDPIGTLIDRDAFDAAERARLRYSEGWFREYVEPEVLKRGLKLDFNHHNLNYWLPSALYYNEHPEWFALLDGQRMRLMDHRQLAFCTNNDEAVDMLVRNVLAFLRANPAVGIVGVIPEDGIGMCQCDRCVPGDSDPKDAFRHFDGNQTAAGENRSKSLRYARLVNRVAREVQKEFPGRLVGQAAYLDIQWPPQGITMESNVVTWLAVGARDAAHPLSADSPSATNRLLSDLLRQWKRIHRGKLILYEYYMGTHSMKSFPYPIADVVCQDWPYLKELGIEGATVQSWSSNHETYGMTNLAFARSGWEDTVDPKEIFDNYVIGNFGRAAAQVQPLFRGLNESVQRIAQKKDVQSLFIAHHAQGELRFDAALVGYFLEELGEQVLRRAAAPVSGGREEAQIRHFGAIIEYWRRGAALMRVALLAERAAKEGRSTEAVALYRKALAGSEDLIVYINSLPVRGWISVSAPAAWREGAIRWRGATERLKAV